MVQNKEKEEGRLRDEIKQKIRNYLRDFLNWLKPDKNQPLAVQIILFLIKLPVVLFVLALSPVFIIILIIAFFLAL
jgi:hypothetical protein